MKQTKAVVRCPWPTFDDPLYLTYHDEEWVVPVRDDRTIYEFLVLETFQAGLSWRTVLHKRAAFRKAFAAFDPKKVSRFTARDVARLLKDAGIIRNRQKIDAAVTNAREFLRVQKEFGSFHRFMWELVDGTPIVNAWRTIRELPAMSPESDAMSRALRERGFRFVGSTICYAHMQATGMVNDHLVQCFRYRQVQSR